MSLQLTAGMISTSFFAASNIAMLVKAKRTRNLVSYSYIHILLTNLANVVHWFYVAALPIGPIWFLHGFYTIVGLLMLVWYLRYERRLRGRGRSRRRWQPTSPGAERGSSLAACASSRASWPIVG